MKERDLKGRDGFAILSATKIDTILSHPKMIEMANSIYQGHYEISSNVMDLSSSFSLLFNEKSTKRDAESDYRFWKKRSRKI